MNPKKPRRNCKQCGKEVHGVVAVYCSNACQREFQYQDYIRRWKVGEVSGNRGTTSISLNIRHYLIDRDGEQCSICGWDERHHVTNRVPLEIDHVDGNHGNHSEANLRLICPNCHSLTPTFRNLNKGNGRPSRRKNGKDAVSPT